MISDRETVTDVAARFGVARMTVHDWLARYEAGGLENLCDRVSSAEVVFAPDAVCGEAAIARMRSDLDDHAGRASPGEYRNVRLQ